MPTLRNFVEQFSSNWFTSSKDKFCFINLMQQDQTSRCGLRNTQLTLTACIWQDDGYLHKINFDYILVMPHTDC